MQQHCLLQLWSITTRRTLLGARTTIFTYAEPTSKQHLEPAGMLLANTRIYSQSWAPVTFQRSGKVPCTTLLSTDMQETLEVQAAAAAHAFAL